MSVLAASHQRCEQELVGGGAQVGEREETEENFACHLIGFKVWPR